MKINGLNLYSYCNNNPIKYLDYRGNIPVEIDVITTIINNSVDFTSFVINQVLKVTPPLTMQEAKRKARKGGHVKSARKIIKDRTNDISDLSKTKSNLNKFSKNFGRAMLAVDIAWSLVENIVSGSDNWITDTAIDAGISIAIYAIGAIPVVGWAASIGASILVSIFDNEIELFKDWIAEQVDSL